jgi:hypothetical protein
VDEFNSWLSLTPLSIALRVAGWIIPTAQTIHILAIAAVLGASLIIQLRILGIGKRSDLDTITIARLLPCIWYALPVLAFTGAVLIVAEPDRALGSGLPVFLTKMGALATASALTLWLQTRIRRTTRITDRSDIIRMRVPAVIVLLLWVVVVSAGRWIAYW